jgi:hypothetical protein
MVIEIPTSLQVHASPSSTLTLFIVVVLITATAGCSNCSANYLILLSLAIVAATLLPTSYCPPLRSQICISLPAHLSLQNQVHLHPEICLCL